MRESAAISSIVPNGKLGADPTIYKRTNIKIISIRGHETGIYHNRISVDQAGHCVDVDFERYWIYRRITKFNLEVFCAFVERSMSCDRYDPNY
jgi:hypothetical protein